MNRDKFTEKELLEARERNKNSIKFKNDTVWESRSFGSFTIIGRLDKTRLYIQFHNTGAIYIKDNSHICKGNIKDLYAPNVYNVAWIGEGIYNSKSHKTIYSRWIGMLNRIYGDDYHTYKDCSVSEHWLNFQNFARDIEELMREKGIDSLEGYQIDKDIKIKGNKVYSKDTVSLVMLSENLKEMLERRCSTVYIAENLVTGEVIELTNQRQFAREHNINKDCISNIIRGKQRSTKNWTFYEKGGKAPIIDKIVYIAENLTTGEKIEFTNQAEFSREYGTNRSSMSKVLSGKMKTSKGWTFYRKGYKTFNIEDFRDTVYIAENVKTGEKIEFTNQSQFAREHGLNGSNISNILAGKGKTVKGWTFYRKDKI